MIEGCRRMKMRLKHACAALLFSLLSGCRCPRKARRRSCLASRASAAASRPSTSPRKSAPSNATGWTSTFYLLQGGSQALQVLLSGDIKLISGGGGTAAQRARFKGAGNLLVATYTPTMPYSLYVNGKIQDAKRLKGAKIAISRFGSSSDFAARFMVDSFGP